MTINILLITLVIIFAWLKYKHYVAHKYKYKIYALRDKLRDKAIDGLIKREWYFSYLDDVLSRHVSELETVNIWAIIMLSYKRRNDKVVIDFRNRLNFALEKNEEFKNIYKEYLSTIGQFFIRKHLITFILITITGLPVINSFLIASSYYQRIKVFLKQKFIELVELPENTVPVLSPI